MDTKHLNWSQMVLCFRCLEHPHQWMQKFCIFTHLKPTFSILHSHFYKTPTSVCLLYTFIQIKYCKTFVSWVSYAEPINASDQSTHQNPSHHQPDQYPRINTHQNPLIKIINCVTTESNSFSLYQVKGEPQASAFAVTIASTRPTHHVLESSAKALFLGLVRCGLLVDLNEPPPLWFAWWSQWASSLLLLFFLTFSFAILESSELLQWSP